MTVCDATVMVPLRADPVLRSMSSATSPFPEPAAPETRWIQLTPLLAFQAHSCAEVTVMVRWPPLGSIEIKVGDTP